MVQIVDNFELTGFSGLCSDIGKVILGYEDECLEAAKTLADGRFSSWAYGSRDYPKGCFLYQTGKVFWNPNDNGKREGHSRAICFKVGKYTSLICNV